MGRKKTWFDCPTCPRRFKGPHHLAKHLKSHPALSGLSVANADAMAREKFKCLKCGGTFRSGLSLKNHMERAHPDETVPVLGVNATVYDAIDRAIADVNGKIARLEHARTDLFSLKDLMTEMGVR